MDSQPTANINVDRAVQDGARGKDVDHPQIYGEPLSFEQIAIRMGLRISQVKGIYRSGMSKLRGRPEALRHMRALAGGLHCSPQVETNEILD